jgi:hypothetical protein
MRQGPNAKTMPTDMAVSFTGGIAVDKKRC